MLAADRLLGVDHSLHAGVDGAERRHRHDDFHVQRTDLRDADVVLLGDELAG